MRNIEIKAKIDDPEVKISLIEQLTNEKCTIIKQHDTFYKEENGRLKVRKFEDDSGELIWYRRYDELGPKLSEYKKESLDPIACARTSNMLNESKGCIGIVKKIRKLYMIGQTRVHIDDVEGLGHFLELEVVLSNEDDIGTGQKIAEDLMNKLNIKSEDLIATAYVDLLPAKQ